ncbi:MAG: hypothetical protein COA78_01855 [Blastopirellula sp.]|nr:MAG: hypothetical protein COA78_01855 [Blastopirellula sp.]
MADKSIDQLCEIETYRDHMTAFVHSFVQSHRQERWLHLLVNRPKQLLKNSSKLYQHLDKQYCTELPYLADISESTTGVFIDFHESSEPVSITTARAIELGMDHDAVFSIAAGKLAVYFFHEGTVMLCQK